MAGVGGVYVVAAGAYIAAVLAPSAQHLQVGADALETEFAVLGARVERLQASFRSVHALVQAGERTAADSSRAAAVRAVLQEVTEGSEGARTGPSPEGIPEAVRSSLADVAAGESRLVGVLLETLDSLDAGDLAAARARLSAAEQPQRSLRQHLDELQRLGLAGVVASGRALDRRARRIADAVALWVVLGAALALLLLALVHRRLFLPLRSLDQGLAGVAAGDLALSLPVRRDDELGRLTGHFNQMTDVLRARAEEGRRHAEEAALRSEEQYRMLVDGVRDVIFALSLDGVLTALNPAFEEITGWRREEWLGRPFTGLLHPDDLPRAAEMLQRVLQDVPRPVSQLRIRTRSGEYRLGEFHTNVLRRGGQVVGVLGIVRDIGDRVRLEEQLRHAQKMEAVGQVASGVAHDFNNLLTAVLCSAELLSEALAPDSPLRDDATTVLDAARRGAELTGKLLAFSRRQPLTLRPTALGSAAADFIRIARRVVPESVTISLQVDAGDATVQADPGALQQILLNLVTNARDALPEGGAIGIEVGRRRLDAADVRVHGWGTPGDYATLAVSDNGCGMDAATRARMFEPFFTTKPVGQGTGLGMPMVYGLVKDHGGFVQVYSEPDHGTTIRLYFPAILAEGVDLTPPPAAAARGGSETILVVEDDDDLRRVTTRVLERYGYTVIGFPDGAEALAAVVAGRAAADLIISDVVMPRAGGPELLHALRQAGVDTRVLLTSGYTSREVKERLAGERAGAVPFIAKPWTVEELLRKVREALAAAGGEGGG